jgi:hypothetical protein
VVDGAYAVGDPSAPVAACVLTSSQLRETLAALSGVAIAGEVQTANLGIERIVTNVVANPAIRFLLLCGRDSRLFRPGQSLVALLERGVDEAGRIVGALGYEPVLRNLGREAIDRFRRQVEVVDWSDELDRAALGGRIEALARRSPGPFVAPGPADQGGPPTPGFRPIRPGGEREPLGHDPKGYFVITLDRPAGQIVLRHYRPDHTPAHEMRGRNASSMLLGLLRERLVSQLSHAGYLGAELARAETALRLELGYQQDRPLRAPEQAPAATGASPGPPGTAELAVPLDAEHLRVTRPGAPVQVVLEVVERRAADELEGRLLEPGAEPRSYRRGDLRLTVRWDERTRVVMGGRPDLREEAVLRAQGRLVREGEVAAELIAVLTAIARVSG